VAYQKFEYTIYLIVANFSIIECILADICDGIRKRDGRQAGAGIESAIPDVCDGLRNRDARQARAAGEGVVADACNRITTNGIRNN